MAAEKLTRTAYRDPTSGLPRSGTTEYVESLVDAEQYTQPLERLHAGNMHEWGVASGLRVTATVNQPGLTVTPGTALDARGRHISLAPGGQAKTDQDTLLEVDADGARLLTTGETGEQYVTIGFAETFDQKTFVESQFTVYQLDHIPLLQFQDVAGFADDGTRLVLAHVTLDATGNVTELGQQQRQATGLPVERISLHRAVRVPAASELTVGHQPAAVIRAGPTGGLDLRVENATDEITFGRDTGSFAKLTIAAESLVARRGDGTQTLSVDVANGRLGIDSAIKPLTALHLPERGLQIGTSPTPSDNFYWASDLIGGPRGLRLYNGDYADGTHRLTILPDGRTGIGTPTPLARLHVRGSGGFGVEDSNGVLLTSDVPLLGQSSLTVIGALNAYGRPAFAIDISGALDTRTARGIPILYDRYDGSWHAAISLKNGHVGIGTIAPLAKLHVVDSGGFGAENADGVLTGVSNVPLLAQSDSTTIGVLNAQGRPAFALNIESNSRTRTSRGVPTFYDRYDGNWRASINLKNGRVGIGTNDPGFSLDVADRVRLRQGPMGTAGMWLSQAGADRAFIGMVDNNNDRVGLWGSGFNNWGLVMNTTKGLVGLGTGINDLIARLNVVTDNEVAVRAFSNAGLLGIGIWAKGSVRAGIFQGNVDVQGTLTKSGGQFRIDHPDDPANRYLCHAFVESDEMKNVYDGVAELDANGAAEIQLANWCESLNQCFRYQITPLDLPAPHLHIAQEFAAGRFTIAGGEPGMRVCWQVTGVRQDAYALAHPLIVEEEKSPDERGHYLHPELHRQPASRSIERVMEHHARRHVATQLTAAQQTQDSAKKGP